MKYDIIDGKFKDYLTLSENLVIINKIFDLSLMSGGPKVENFNKISIKLLLLKDF